MARGKTYRVLNPHGVPAGVPVLSVRRGRTEEFDDLMEGDEIPAARLGAGTLARLLEERLVEEVA